MLETQKITNTGIIGSQQIWRRLESSGKNGRHNLDCSR